MKNSRDLCEHNCPVSALKLAEWNSDILHHELSPHDDPGIIKSFWATLLLGIEFHDVEKSGGNK